MNSRNHELLTGEVVYIRAGPVIPLHKDSMRCKIVLCIEMSRGLCLKKDVITFLLSISN